jgi:[protein-PII] uridylyltransferase
VERAFGPLRGVALVAVGGYGRGELSPHSDIDLLFLAPSRREPGKEQLKGFLYPLWDAGFQVGHSVGSPKSAIERAGTDLHAATTLLCARSITGDDSVFEELLDRRERWLNRNGKTLVRRIVEETMRRHRTAERAGWSLAPDLKEDVGGLRDVHVIRWLDTCASGSAWISDVAGPSGILLATREALHAEAKRKSDRIRMDLQPVVAARLGFLGEDAADRLMAEVHSAARSVEHAVTNAIQGVSTTVLGGPRRSGGVKTVADGVRVEDGVLTLETFTGDLALALRLLAAKASTGRPVDGRALRWLRDAFDIQPVARWDAETKAAFLNLLRSPHASGALELLDHVSGWPVLLPEWGAIRGRAQHDPYHRYTVDGHSFLAVEEVGRVLEEDPDARTAAGEAGDLSPLYLSALLHDIGKGSGQDHSVAGETLARAAAARMGLSTTDIEDVAALVRWHLLLVDTATRRDLDDGAVIAHIAERVGDARRLRLLYLLSAADGRATGPEAWSDWKRALVLELYRKTLVALETGEIPARNDVSHRAREIEAYEPSLAGRAEEVLAALPPSYLDSVSIPDMVDEIRLLTNPPAPGRINLRVDEGGEPGHAVLTVCIPDRPGTLARTAGVLALNRIPVLRAQAYSTSTGLALERFVVRSDKEMLKAVADDLLAAYSGRLALEARLGRKVRDYLPQTPVRCAVEVLQDVSTHSTVVEVRGPDALGLLYAIAAGLSDLDLDIHTAKIDTLGARVVDVFYVRTLWGTKLSDEQAPEVERAIKHRVKQIFG